MNTGLVITLVVLLVLFVLVRLIKPPQACISSFEVSRRLKLDEAGSQVLRERADTIPFLLALRSFASLLIVYAIDGVLSMFVTIWGAAVITIVLVLAMAWITHAKSVERLRAKVYARLEPRLLRLYAIKRYFFFLPPEPIPDTIPISSEPELVHEIEKMRFLSPERKALIHSALEFSGLTVADAMSSRRSIHAIDKGEVLGPLLLDELYKTGRQSFVVTGDSLDDIIGILNLDRLTSLDLKDTPTALKAMIPDVQRIDAGAPISEGLARLRETRSPFIVVQDDSKTVGLLTTDNILRCLFEA